jgi:trans-AT polyketide synthase/acyltransferase/oxidoreductase domain-containing protein
MTDHQPAGPSLSTAFSQPGSLIAGNWQGSSNSVAFGEKEMHSVLLDLGQPLWILRINGQAGLTANGTFTSPSDSSKDGVEVIGFVPAVPVENLGDPGFRAVYGTQAAYYAGAMANAIASEDLVIALGKAGLMGSFGAGGCSPARVETAIQKIKAALPNEPYAFNLLHSPNEPQTELRTAELYIRNNIAVVEASAYLDITYALAYYRISGLSQASDGQILIAHHVIAKLSRKEVALRFLSPASPDLVSRLLEDGKITALQAQPAQRVPVADDITVEADSGGHTDNRPLVCLLPTMLALRDEIQAKHNYAQPVRIGAAGGISTPQSALAAFSMGAAYIATGSVNQSCVEAGASEHTRGLLAQADMADVAMAPSADMFEMGVRVQVLKRGTMFAPRASKLYEIYTRFSTWQDVPVAERDRLENTVFKRKYDEIWNDTVKFFTERDPAQLERALRDPHQQMALVFRWYLGLSSRWSNSGEKGREMDYQIWCGPSMGSFNDWVRGTYLEKPANRRAVDVARHILNGAAYLSRLRSVAYQAVQLPAALDRYLPDQALA